MQDKEFAAILQDEPMQPLALVPLTEEEQVCREHVLRGRQDTCVPVSSVRDRTCVPKHVLSVNKTRSSHSFLLSPFSTFALSTEEFLYVCEQCGSAEAHGKRGGRGCARRGG